MASDKATQTIISCLSGKHTTEADFVLNKDQPSEIDEFKDQKVVRFKLDPPTGFPFLKLPAEARNLVYDSYLISKPVWLRGLDPITLHQPALTRVNRIIRKETLEMFYAGNVFGLCLEAFDPSIETPGEEHQRLRLLRSLRALKRSGHFGFIGELDIWLTPSRWKDCVWLPDYRGADRSLEITILHRERFPTVDKYPESFYNGECHGSNYRLDTAIVDWSSFEAVHSTVEVRKHRLMGLMDPVADDNLPSGRLIEVLQILLGESELAEEFRWVVFADNREFSLAPASQVWR